MAFSPDSATLASGGDDSTMRLWDVVSGAQLACVDFGKDNSVRVLCFSPDGKTVAVESEAQTRLYDVASGTWTTSFSDRHIHAVTCAKLAPDGRLLASGSDDHSLRLWAAGSGKWLATVSVPGKVAMLAFSGDGKVLAAAAVADATIAVVDVATHRVVSTVTLTADVTCMGVSHDGAKIAVALGNDSSIQLLLVRA